MSGELDNAIHGAGEVPGAASISRREDVTRDRKPRDRKRRGASRRSRKRSDSVSDSEAAAQSGATGDGESHEVDYIA